MIAWEYACTSYTIYTLSLISNSKACDCIFLLFFLSFFLLQARFKSLFRRNSLSPVHLGYPLLCHTFSSLWWHQHWNFSDKNEMKLSNIFNFIGFQISVWFSIQYVVSISKWRKRIKISQNTVQTLLTLHRGSDINIHHVGLPLHESAVNIQVCNRL